MSLLTRVLCACLGGHDLGLPKVIDGRLRLACQHGCGFMTAGIETRGQEQQRRPKNLLTYRSDRSVWSKPRKKRINAA